jgi:hypothetical protein
MLAVGLLIGFFVYYSTNSTIVHLNETISKSKVHFIPDYYVNTTEEGFDLTISSISLENCSHSLLTLVDYILLCSLNITESVITFKLINLCVYINIESIEKLKNIRRLIFENCTISFQASPQREDYDFYPRNLSRWSFHQGQTDSFDQFIAIINHLGKSF